MSDSPQHDLIMKLAEKYEEYRRDPDAAIRRWEESAYEQAEQDILTSVKSYSRFEREALAAAAAGQKTYRLLTWQGRGPQYNRQCLSDMLDKGNLLERMQTWLDKSYGVNSLRIFNHHIKFSRNGYALVISWDVDKFDSIGEIIASNRAQAQAQAQAQVPEQTKRPQRPARAQASVPKKELEPAQVSVPTQDSVPTQVSVEGFDCLSWEVPPGVARAQEKRKLRRKPGQAPDPRAGGNELVDPDEPVIFSQPAVRRNFRR